MWVLHTHSHPSSQPFTPCFFNRQCSFQATWLKRRRILAKLKTVMESRNGSAHFVFELLKKRRTLSGSSHKLLHAIAAIMSLFFAAGHSWEYCRRPFEAICLGCGFEMAKPFQQWRMIASDHTYLKTSKTLDKTSMKTMQYTWNLARKHVKIPQNMQNAPDIFVKNFIRYKMYDPQNALDISLPLGVNCNLTCTSWVGWWVTNICSTPLWANLGYLSCHWHLICHCRKYLVMVNFLRQAVLLFRYAL